MSPDTDPPILVAVDSAEKAQPAIAYAAREALRMNCGLRLLHVVSPSALTPSEAYLWVDFVGPAEDMLRGLADQIRERVGDGLPVTCEAITGPVVRTIVDHSRASRLLVITGEETGHLDRLITGQVRNGVASRAHVPVVCVPSTWSPDQDRKPVVLVGVDDPHPSSELVRTALAAATERHCTVQYVYAWWFTEPLDDTAFTIARAGEWCHFMQQALRRDVERVAEQTVGTAEIEATVVHERPAAALVERSQDAQLLILGRHDRRLPFGSHLGPVVRAVLRHAACPVMVVDTKIQRQQPNHT